MQLWARAPAAAAFGPLETKRAEGEKGAGGGSARERGKGGGGNRGGPLDDWNARGPRLRQRDGSQRADLRPTGSDYPHIGKKRGDGGGCGKGERGVMEKDGRAFLWSGVLRLTSLKQVYAGGEEGEEGEEGKWFLSGDGYRELGFAQRDQRSTADRGRRAGGTTRRRAPCPLRRRRPANRRSGVCVCVCGADVAGHRRVDRPVT